MDLKQLPTLLKRAGLQQRDSQLSMMEAVNTAVKKHQILCVEAPTGTGKTLAYGIGSFLAKPAKHSLIISTATIALQEQLVNKDLPLMAQILDQKINYALAKGRRRYVCHLRLYRQNDLLTDLFESSDYASTLQSLLEKKQWNGDRDELDEVIPQAEWQKLSTDSAGCSGRLCEFYEDCAFYKARKKMYQADIVVTNHSLLLSDLELGGGVLLPEPENSIYIVDECHHLPVKAIDHFAKHTSLLGAVEWINQLNKTIQRAVQNKEIADKYVDIYKSLTQPLVDELKLLREILQQNNTRFDDDIWLIEESEVDSFSSAQQLLKLAQELFQHSATIQEQLEENARQQEKSSPDRFQSINKLLASLGFAMSRLENFIDTWRLFCHQRGKNEAPIARWFALRDNLSRDSDAPAQLYHCHTSPINVSKELEGYLWNKAKNGVVLCSATVRSLGNFKDYQRKTGLLNHPNYHEQHIEPYFEFENSVLFVPTMKTEPSGANQSAHQAEVIELLPELILPHNGTLVLFTSRKAMELTEKAMPDKIKRDILMQGSTGKDKLIKKHKKRIRDGKRSILFGLASFGEGLDLPADFCQHVIINKLPFAVPSTPIELTRNAWLSKNRLNAFMLSTLPATSLRLAQYVGRLLRQETDKGIVTILDRRLYTKNYGSQLLESLPGFTRIINQPVTQMREHEKAQTFYCD